jgi:vitamin B12 transporter
MYQLYLRSYLRFEFGFRGRVRLLLLSAALPAAGSAAIAQEVVELPPVVVEGATLEAPPVKKKSGSSNGTASSQAPSAATAGASTGDGIAATSGVENGIPASEIGSAVTVVTGAQLRAQQIRHAADALQSLPGVSVNRQGTFNNLTVVRIRGAESNHTLVLIDGVEVNSASTDGFFDFSNLGADEIEQIEVVRGPQGGLYGTGAIGGVINIITKAGKGPLTVRARAEAGGFGTRDGAVQISGGDDDLYGSVTVQGRTTDGFNISTAGNEDDGGDLSTFAFRGGIALLPNLIVDGTLRMSKNEGDRDGFNGNLNGFAVPSDDTSVFTNRLWVGRLQATLDTLDGDLVHKLYLSGTETDSRDTDGTFGSFLHSVGDATKFGYRTTYRLATPGVPGVQHYVTALVERERQRFEQPSDPTMPHRERHTSSFAGEVRGEYFEQLFVTANIRHDDNDFVEDFTTWRLAGTYAVPQTPFRVHASAGTGVKYPSLSEQFGSFAFFTPNPDLIPEEAFGWDIGVETTVLPGRAVIDVTYFDTELTNEIDFRTLPNFNTQPFNRDGDSSRQGIEVAARYLLAENLTLGAAYTYLRAREEDGSEEIRRPPHSGRFDVNYGFDGGRGNLNVAAIYNGDMLDNAFDAVTFAPSQVVLEEYWLLNVAASYELSPGLEVYGRVENALDESYQQIFGYEMAGVAAYAGMRFQLQERVSEFRGAE